MARLGRAQPFKPIYGLPVWRSIVRKVSSMILNDAGLLGYWKLDELSGTSAADSSGNAFTGTWIGTPSWVAGLFGNAASFDGTTNAINIYSSSFNTAFNGSEGTYSVWAKVGSAGVWTDATARVLLDLSVDGNNTVRLNRTATNNTINLFYIAGGTTKQTLTTAPGGSTGWVHYALTWSKAADQVMAYVNGVQVGSTLTGLGTWAGNLSGAGTVIGAINTTPTQAWSGSIDDVRVYNRALSSGEISALYDSVPGLLGVSRIQLVVNATLTGLARITAITTKTITGVTRITVSTLRTILGVARIQKAALQTILGLARITVSTLRTITGVSRITVSTLQTILGKSRITVSATQTLLGVSRVVVTTLKTITGKSRIQKVVNQTLAGVSRVQKAISQTITGISSIVASYTTTQRSITGTSRIFAPKWEVDASQSWYSKSAPFWETDASQNWWRKDQVI